MEIKKYRLCPQQQEASHPPGFGSGLVYGDILQEDDVAMAFLEVCGDHPFQECVFCPTIQGPPTGMAASLERV